MKKYCKLYALNCSMVFNKRMLVFFLFLPPFFLYPWIDSPLVQAADPTILEIKLYDWQGLLVTSDRLTISLYQQNVDGRGAILEGNRVATKKTERSGANLFTVNADRDGIVYLAKVFELNEKVGSQIFYDLRVSKNRRQLVELKLSGLSVVIRDSRGKPILNRTFDLYTQTTDVDGIPVAGTEVKRGLTMDATGKRELVLAPGNYVIRVATSGSLYREKKNITVQDQKITSLDFSLENVSVQARTALGVLLKNASFEVYQQTTDADGIPQLGAKVGSFKIGATGETFLSLKEGTYVFRFFGTGNRPADVVNQSVIESGLSTIRYRFGGITLSVNNDRREPIPNVLVECATQTRATGKDTRGERIFSVRTNTSGVIETQVAPGTYACTYKGITVFNVPARADEQTIVTITDPGVKERPPKFLITFTQETPGSTTERADDDQDGLTNAEELRLGTSPTNPDTDGDGYSDLEELKTGYDPLDPRPIKKNNPTHRAVFAYGKPRLASLADEQQQAIELKAALERIFGNRFLGVAASDWATLVNAFIYGAYTAAEIADTIQSGPRAVHPTIPASQWRTSADYQRYVQEK